MAVPDERLDKLAALYQSKKVTPAVIEFVDIAGLVKGASRGEGLGNKFLSHIREVDAIVHVVRCFEDANITHVENSIDPVRDIETINLELILSDMEAVQNRLGKIKSNARGGADKKAADEYAFLEKLYAHLEAEKPARTFAVADAEEEFMRSLFLLTVKPVIYAANIKESDMGKRKTPSPTSVKVKEFAAKEGSEVLVICAKTEEELSQMDAEDKAVFMESSGLGKAVLTALSKNHTRFWGSSHTSPRAKRKRVLTIVKGTKAPQAAGKIHSDFEKGFIRADVVYWETLVELGSRRRCQGEGQGAFRGQGIRHAGRRRRRVLLQRFQERQIIDADNSLKRERREKDLLRRRRKNRTKAQRKL